MILISIRSALIRNYLFLSSLVFIFACSSMPDHYHQTFALLAKGMSSEDVIRYVGPPDEKKEIKGEIIWRYFKAKRELVFIKNRLTEEKILPVWPPLKVVTEKDAGKEQLQIECAGQNTYGHYPEGGGCNQFGCWPKGGSCNQYGCSLEGTCQAKECKKPVKDFQCH